jgi:hypothetical protein
MAFYPLLLKSVTTEYLFSRYLYVAISAIPGPVIAGFLIEIKCLGRKHAGEIIAVLIGLFMFLVTVARTRDAALAFECILTFLEHASLAVIATYTVEVLPAPVRGSGLAVMCLFWGLFGLVSHIITAFASSTVAGDDVVWFCGAICVVMGAT